MKKLFLLVSFTLAAIGICLGNEPPLYSYQNNLSNYKSGWPVKKNRIIDLKLESSIFNSSITPVSGIATNSFVALANNNIVNAFNYTSGTITPVAGVATNSYIALMSNNVVNAINNYTSAPTFSNVSINGYLNVAGNTTLTGLINNGNSVINGSITTPTLYGSSAASGTLNIFSTSSATAGVINIGTSTGTMNLNSSVANLTSSTIIGTGTVAANTTSLGILRVKQGSSWADFGERSAGLFGVWFGQTPTTTNYGILGGGGDTYVNGTSLYLASGGTAVGTITSGLFKTTGQFSVSSTSTLTGAAKQTNTLNYEGNTTWNTNQTNTLTTGNSGTVAVLSDAVFTTKHMGGVSAGLSPADATTYYIGTVGYTMSGNRTGGIYIPYNATIVGFTSTSILTTTASAETFSLQVWQNNTTATNLSTSLTMTTAVNTHSASALNISVSAGDYIETRFISPTWATNPTGVSFEVTLFYVRRQ